ncbi:hypothetical protein [Pontibacter liquoris]|uniref:hypothetical protein n=1 Tax=Pontibacter liquoris TaxID=2905677 RepID=UPI001FA760D1|nr:hypothetical protein [Pontibacter liquoris]
MRLKPLLLFLLLLCSCATERMAEKFFDENTAKLAEYVDKDTAYTRKYGAAYAAKHFPSRLQAPAIPQRLQLTPERLAPGPLLIRVPVAGYARGAGNCPTCQPTYVTKTVFLRDTTQLLALQTRLARERTTGKVIRQQLKKTEGERDYWRDMNRKKLWALIAMAIFALLYILFKVLASRVREFDEEKDEPGNG